MYLDKSDEFCLEILAMLGHNRDEENTLNRRGPLAGRGKGGAHA